MPAFLGEQNLVSVKLQLIVALREIVAVYDVTAGVRDRYRLRGFVLVHAAARCPDAARSLVPLSAKRPMQRNNFFSRSHRCHPTNWSLRGGFSTRPWVLIPDSFARSVAGIQLGDEPGIGGLAFASGPMGDYGHGRLIWVWVP